MNSSSRNEFRKHLSAILRIDRNFRAEFTGLLLRYHDGDIIELSELLMGRMIPFQGIGLIDLLNDPRIKIFIRVMQMTGDRISWSRRFRNVAFLDETGIDLLRISNATLRGSQFQVFDDLDGAERSILEQLSTAEIDFISDLTSLGFNVFLTISRLSEKEILFLLSLKIEQLESMIKLSFKKTCLLARHDKGIRNELLESEPDERLDDKLIEGISKLNWRDRAGLRVLLDEHGSIIKDFSIEENMDRVLESIVRCSEDDLITLRLGGLRRFDQTETDILKRIPLIVFKMASTLTRIELDEILILPKGMFRTIEKSRDFRGGYPQTPGNNRLEEMRETAFRSLNQDERNVLCRIHKLPPRAVAMLLNFDLDRIKRIMTSKVGSNRKEEYLRRQFENLSPQNRHDIRWMTDEEWNSFHNIRYFDGHICDILMNLNGPEIDVLRAMNSLNEKQLDFVSRMSRTGLGVLATNNRLGPKMINSIMQLRNEKEKVFLLNLGPETRFSIMNGGQKQAMTSEGRELLEEMMELNDREKWWLEQTEFNIKDMELFTYLNRHRAEVFGGLFEKIESDKHPVFDVWNGEKLSEMDTELLASVIIAQRPKSIEFLPVLDFLDSIFFMKLLQLSVEASCDQALRLNIIQGIRRRDFKVRDLVNVYDYSKRQHVQSLRWILMNSLEPGNGILFDFARMTLFDNLYKRNNLTFEQIFHPTSEEVVPALHRQFAVEEYHLAKALFFHLSDSTRLFEILNRVDCSILLESDITKDTHTIPYVDELTWNGHDLFPIFPTNTIKLLKVSNYLNRGDVVPLLKKLPKERLVEFFHTNLGNEFLHSSLSNGRVKLLRYLRQRLTEEELRAIIRMKDYSLQSVRSGKSGQQLATILHMLREIDPEISNNSYIRHSTELIEDVQAIAPPATTISILRSLPIDSIKLQDLIGSMWDALNPEVRSILSNQVSNGCNDSSIPCIDSRDHREIPSGAKNIFNKVANTNSEFMRSFKEKLWNAEYDHSNPIILSIVEILWPNSEGLELIRKIRTSAIMSLIAGQHVLPPAKASIYEMAEHMASRFPQVARKSIRRFLGMMAPDDLDIFSGTNSIDIAEGHRATGVVLDYFRLHISHLEMEDHSVYWSMFWNNGNTWTGEVDVVPEARSVLEDFASRVFERFEVHYDSIGLSLPRWIMGWKRYYTCPSQCILKTHSMPVKLVFDRKAVVRNPYEQNQTLLDSSFLPQRFGDYNFVCGPSASNLSIEIQQTSRDISTGRYRLPGKVVDRCQNFALYEKDDTTRTKSMLYIAQDYFEWKSISHSIDLIFLGREINFIDTGSNMTTNHFMLKGDSTTCKIHKKGLNFFYTDKNEFLCDLDITQNNVAVIHGDFKDSEFINSVLGSGYRNKITISHASFVDGGGGNDEIIALHPTIVRAHHGDLIIGTATVLLPGSIDQIQSITIEPTTFVFRYKTRSRIEVDKNCKFMLGDDYYVHPIQDRDESNRIHRISLRKTVGIPIDATELGRMRHDNFAFIKYLSSPGQIIIITEMDHNIFITDHDDHQYYWEAPPDSRNLYIFTRLNSTATISQANGVLDFTSFDITLEGIALRKTNGGFTIDHENLHVILLPNHNEVRMTFDGKKYYKLHFDGPERDYCSHPMKVRGRISIQSLEFIHHYDCLDVQSEEVYFLRSNEHLILVCNAGTLYLENYYPFIHNKLDLSLRLNFYIMEPAEVWRRASNPSSIKYYEVDKRGLKIYHNQPENKYDIGLINFGGWPSTKCNMTISDGSLLITLADFSSVTVKNWNTHQSSRDIVFHFKDELLLNTGCIISNCYSDDVLHEFEMMKFQRNNFGFFFLVFQNWLDRKYPLPVRHCDAPEETFADAYTLTETLKTAMNRTAEELHISLDGFDIFNVYKNVSRLMRAEKYFLVLDHFHEIAESVGLDGDILLDRFFEIIRDNC